VLVALHGALARPLWYDEIWRPHFLSEPPSDYWAELAHANTPSALAWAVLTRLDGDVFGWHAWALRLPELLALVALPAVTYLFLRRLAGPVAAGLGAAGLGLSGVVVDLGTQLKPYSVEALASVVMVWLWMAVPVTEPGLRRLWSRTAAGLVSLFAVPGAFVIIPLAAVDVVTAGYGYRRGRWRIGWRHRLRAAATAAPAVAVCGLHTLLFIGHQSSQRASQFWDTQFLAGRGPADAARFVAVEVLHIFGGAPTGVDRYDPNLVHPVVNTSFAADWLLAPTAGVAFAVGLVALTRRADGRYPAWAAVGALLLALVASAGRYWPFGANRTNTFLVPLLVTVVVVGADRLALRARDHNPLASPGGRLGRVGGRLGLRILGHAGPPGRGGARVVMAATLVVLALGPIASASALGPLWRERAQVRPVALMVDATTLTRRLYRPGDVVVVGGRLARSGWLYAMDVSADGAYLPAPVSPLLTAQIGPRVPDDATVFLNAVGSGQTSHALLERRGPAPSRVLLFILVYDQPGRPSELAWLRREDWCPQDPGFSFPGTGTLDVLVRCGRPHP
jgi:hypothetical protein